MKSAAAILTALANSSKIIPLQYTVLERTNKYNENDTKNLKLCLSDPYLRS